MDNRTSPVSSYLIATFSRRKLLMVVGGATGLLAASKLWMPARIALAEPLAQAGAAWNHDPAASIGPSDWAEIGYPVCGSGMGQSPINIDTRAVVDRNLDALALTYWESPLEVENTGHVVEVPIPSEVPDTLRFGNDSYPLVQFHFHAPSEHTVDGRSADVEAHFVHQTASGATAVVAVLFRIDENPNPLLETILRSASTSTDEHIDVGDANPLALFAGLTGGSLPPVQIPSRAAAGDAASEQLNIQSFYFYDGSLTTPGCTEPVRWFVLPGAGRVSSSAVEDFHTLISTFPGYGGYANNNRPVQPLNGRTVSRRVAANALDSTHRAS